MIKPGVKEKLENYIAQCNGFEQPYKNKMYPFEYSEGVRFVAMEAGAYWMIDLIASWQMEILKKSLPDVQYWKFETKEDAQHFRQCIATCTNYLDQELAQQGPFYTDFPLDVIHLFLDYSTERPILMLSAEQKSEE